jgi:SSS family solute:Na+ symporter
MVGLQILDILVIVVYFIFVIWIGYRASKNIKNQEDYLLAGRKFGKLVQTFASFGQATSADGPVGVGTTTFHNGAAGIWSALLMVFSTPLYWITSPWQRRLRVLTMGDFYEERYSSRKMAATYAIVATVGMMGLLSAGYTAMNKTILAITPKPVSALTLEEQQEYQLSNELADLESKDSALYTSAEKNRLAELRALHPKSNFSYLNESMLVWIVCIIVIIYAVLGGLEAAFLTDLLQGIFIIFLSIILIPFAWHAIVKNYGQPGESALRILHEKLPESFFEIFGSPTLIDFTWYFIIAAALVAGITVVTQPNQLVTNAAAKDEHSARFGFVTGVFIKRFCTILWGVVGLAAVLLYTGKVNDSDLIWGYATKDLLGPAGFGLVGLMIASMMAALMSTADALMLTVSGLLLHNVYRLLVKDKKESHYIWTGRVLGALFLTGAAIITTQFDNIFEILKFIWEFFVIFAAAFWLGLKWRRANRIGAWSSILISLCAFYLLPLLVPNMFPSLKTSEPLLIKTDPQPVVRVYTARGMDVEQRNREIAQWRKRSEQGLATGKAPEELKVGDKYSKTYALPARTIMWSKQATLNESGQLEARGYLFLELVALQAMGCDLHKMPYALVETIRMMIRLLTPFLLLIFISLLTRPDGDETHFFLKMRTRVRGLGLDIDAQDVKDSIAHPEKTRAVLLFPKSQFEIYRWNRQDVYGFLISILIVFVVLGTLVAVIKIY